MAGPKRVGAAPILPPNTPSASSTIPPLTSPGPGAILSAMMNNMIVRTHHHHHDNAAGPVVLLVVAPCVVMPSRERARSDCKPSGPPGGFFVYLKPVEPLTMNQPSQQIRIALPSKGRMEEETLDLLAAAGLHVSKTNPRQYSASIPALPGALVLFQRTADLP